MFRYLIVLFLTLLTDLSFGQVVLSQTHNDATIGIDRKAWNGLGNTSSHSDGYAHDFTLPARTNPCQQITGIRVEISLTDYINNNVCPHFENYFNLFYGCTSYAGGATCLPATNLIAEPNYAPNTSPQPFNFGSPLGSSLNSNIVPDFGDNLSIDIIPVSNPGCNPVTNGHISYQYTITVTVAVTDIPPTPPTFTQVPAICSGDSLSALPTTSNNSITGTWAPILDNTTTTTYTFTPDAGQCATTQTMTITANPIETPLFTQIPPICSGDTLTALPTASNNGITGIWSPALNNMSTTMYTFIPDAGQCAENQSMVITVNPIETPLFTQILPICSDDTLTALPTTSNNGITGTWTPALNNTTTTTYTFTPNTGQCIANQTMTITVNPIVTPMFTQVPAICSGDTLAALPTASNNGIIGTWSPALNNTATTMYTFTPNTGQCAANQTMTITVNPTETPAFTQVSAICSGDTLTALPITSNNGITGNWSPALNNTVTTTYTFTPDPEFCPSPVDLTVEVFNNPVFSLQNEYILCFDINGTLMSPVSIDTGLQTNLYNFTWFLNDEEIAGANQELYMPVVEGNYNVIVENRMTMCSTNDSTVVTAVTQPNFEVNVVTDVFLDNQTIEVTTITSGDFEFQLDDGLWQNSPVFNNASIGEHTVTVRDKRGCIETSKQLIVIGYPKYFTPNDDGTHDTWNIVASSITSFLDSAKIYIFDRYGKFLKQINPTGLGWTGIHNGANMPSDDYWFIIEYNEPNTGIRKTFKAHFALKR